MLRGPVRSDNPWRDPLGARLLSAPSMPIFFHFAAMNSLIGAALTLISIPLILALRSLSNAPEFSDRVVRWTTQNYRVTILSLIAIVILSLILSVWAARAFPNSGDEYTYLFQADTLLGGRLWNSLDPLHQYFSFWNIFEKDDKWVGSYTPGWPLIVACAKFIAIPAYAVSPICAVLLVLVAARLYGEAAGPLAAIVGIVLLAINPFFLLNGASYFPHISAALFGTIFTLYGLRYLDSPKISSALIVGSALGAVGTIRPYSAVLFAIPFGVEWLLRRHYDFKTVVWIVVAGLPFLAGLLAYNWAITGNPLLFVQHWGYPLIRLGIHPRDELGNELNLFDTSLITTQRLAEFALWTSPMLILLFLFAGYQKVISRTLRFYDFVFPMFVAGYVLFPQVALLDNRYGPRYYLEPYPILVLTIVSGLLPYLSSRLDRKASTVIGVGLAASIFACLMLPVYLIENRRVVDERMAPYDLVRDAKISHAVVVLQTGSGTIAPMEPMDLTRNGINVRDADVIFALSRTNGAWLEETGQDTDEESLNLIELLQAFPDRNFYAFERQESGQATLRKLGR